MHQTISGRAWRILLMSSGRAFSAEKMKGFSRAGWDVLDVSDPIEALSAVKSRDVDLALLCLPVEETLDMDLPNVLRCVCPADYLPVMIVTLNAEARKRCEYLDSGADDVISEETSPAETVSRMRAGLRIKELHDQLAASREALERSLVRERKLMAKLRRDNAHLQTLCTTDPLTHLQNVRSFEDIIQHEFRIARRYEHSLSLLMLDVDHFKVVNDTHGHPSGDYVLKELAVILKNAVRESDVVARTGGEEFSVILPKAGRKEAFRLADHIRKDVSKRLFIVYGDRIHVTISTGVATFPHDAEIVEAEMLVYLADQALLEAKESGRDRVLAVDDLSMVSRRRLRQQYQRSRRHLAETLVGQEIPRITIA